MKIPVFCSLIPTDLICAAGFTLEFINAGEHLCTHDRKAECVFHENLCSYSKALYDFFMARHSEFALIIIPSSCDALKKLYNALTAALSSDKIYLLDIPQIKTPAAEVYLAQEFSKLSDKLRKYTPGCAPCAGFKKTNPRTTGDRIGIIGSNVPLKTVGERLDVFGFEPFFINHCIDKAMPDSKLRSTLDERGLAEYARLFIEKNSCPRTNSDEYRKKILRTIEERGLSGIIVNAFKFCDFQPFDYKFFKEELGPDFPIMLMEHDLGTGTEGQIMTRIDAFLENISKISKSKTRRAAASGRFYVGIDSGSHATKIVCVEKDGNVISRKLLPTGTSVKNSAAELVKDLCRKLNIERKDIARIVATGYGRNEIGGADEIVTEITCHAIGAYQTLSKSMTLIDIGGQDSKAIKIGNGGRVERFAMNDKCAAGTGRFLEVMSAKLEMSLSEFAEISMRADSYVPISNMCSVFAESEVISLIASGKSKEEIAKGIHRSIAERTIGLMKRIEGAPPYYMAGGGAKNPALIEELEECLGEKVAVLNEPQFSGAYGAATLAARE